MTPVLLEVVVDHVDPDEACLGARVGGELVRLPDGSTDEHWVERVYIVRGGKPATYVQDFGTIDDWYWAQPMIVLPAVEDMGEPLDECVGEVLEMLERHRYDDTYYRRLAEIREASTLVSDINRQRQQWALALRNRSVFGPYAKHQLNDYPSEHAARLARDERARRSGKRRFAT